jgi:hypothetical protein
MYTPSMIAAACVAAALHGLDWTGKSGHGISELLCHLTRITTIEQVNNAYTFVHEECVNTWTASSHPHVADARVSAKTSSHMAFRGLEIISLIIDQ